MRAVAESVKDSQKISGCQGLQAIYPMRIYLFIAFLPEKAVANHSSTLAWKISWTEEPGRLQSMGLLRVRHD